MWPQNRREQEFFSGFKSICIHSKYHFKLGAANFEYVFYVRNKVYL